MDFSTIKGVTLPNNLQVVKMQHGNDILWQSVGEDYSAEPMFIKNETANAGTVSIVKSSSSAYNVEVYTSTDNSTWDLLGTTSTIAMTATLPANGRLYIRATASAWGGSGNNYYNKISADVSHSVCGNILSLLYGADFANYTSLPSNNRAFTGLFKSNTNLVSAEHLIMPDNIYTNCYRQMFYGCSHLTTAPELPALSISSSCYNNMFYNCSSLNYVKALMTSSWSSSYSNSWLNGVSATGTFVLNGANTNVITRGVSNIPIGWDVEYTYLTAPTVTASTTEPNTAVISRVHPLASIVYTIQPDGGSEGSPITDTTTGDVVVPFNASCTIRAYETDASGNMSSVTSEYFNASLKIDFYEDRGISTFTNNNVEDVTMYYTLDETTPDTSSSSVTITANGGTKVFDKSVDRTIDTIKYYGVGNVSGNETMMQTKYMYPDLLYIETLESGTTIKLLSNSTSALSSYYDWTNTSTSTSTSKSIKYFTEEEYHNGSSASGTTKTVPCSITTTSGVTLVSSAAANTKHYFMLNDFATFGMNRNRNGLLYFYFDVNHTYNIGGNMYTFGCKEINNVPNLLCNYLFDNSTTLINAGNLIIGDENITLYYNSWAGSGTTYYYARACSYMFRLCTALTTAPMLPATTLANECYTYMFNGCTSLTEAPELPALNLVSGCYSAMFAGCTSLSYIKAMFKTTPSSSYTTSWMNSVAATGLFIKNPDATWSVTGNYGVPTGWTESTIEPFYIKDVSGGTNTITVKCPTTGSLDSFTVYTSTNGVTWTELGTVSVGGTDLTTTVSANKKMFIGASTNQWGIDDNTFASISCSGNHIIGGDLRTLLDYQSYSTYTFANTTYQFYRLFYNNTRLISAENLYIADITLKSCCYRGLFEGCTSLTVAPELNSSTMVTRCYQAMFKNCSSLTKAPELKATTLTASCYEEMFYGCSSLNYIYSLNTTTPSSSYTLNWVDGVAATGTFVKNGLATWNVVGVNGVPTGWVEEVDIHPVPFYVENLTNSSITLTYKAPGYWGGTKTLYYSSNGTSWSTWASVTSAYQTKTLSIPANSRRYIKTDMTSFTTSVRYSGQTTPSFYASNFSCNGNFAIGGNIVKLLADETMGQYTYYREFYLLFQNATYLVSAQNLLMPEVLYERSCYGTFSGCTALTTAPYLPALSLASECYGTLFSGCTSLNYIKAMFLSTPSTSVTYNWVNNVASSGTFVKNSSATWSVSGVHGIPSGWTVQTASS